MIRIQQKKLGHTYYNEHMLENFNAIKYYETNKNYDFNITNDNKQKSKIFIAIKMQCNKQKLCRDYKPKLTVNHPHS